MKSLYFAVKGLFRLAFKSCNDIYVSLPEFNQIMSKFWSVLINTALIIMLIIFLVLAVSGAALMMLKIMALVALSWQGTFLEGAATAINEANRNLSEMTFFKIAAPVFFMTFLFSVLSSMCITKKGVSSAWRQLVKAGKDK